MISIREAAGITPEQERRVMARAEIDLFDKGLAAIGTAFATIGNALLGLAETMVEFGKAVVKAITRVETRKASYAVYPGAEQGYRHRGKYRR